MSATNIAIITSFKAAAASPYNQGVWMPAVAWQNAIRIETETVHSDQAVSEAINKVIEDFGATFTVDATGLKLNVFVHRYSVIKAGAKKGQLLPFFFVQSSEKPNPIVPTDSSFWQIRYNLYTRKFQPETRDRKRQRVAFFPPVELTEEQVTENLKLLDELRAITEEESRRKAKQDVIASSSESDERPEEPIAMPPSNQQDFCAWIRQNWHIDFPWHPFPENMMFLEDAKTPSFRKLFNSD
jgi:hypothetical protein